jgi:excisionase family DNA binding protein
MEKRTYSIGEAAQVLGISKQFAYELARKQELPGIRRLGGRYLVSKVELESYLNKQS